MKKIDILWGEQSEVYDNEMSVPIEWVDKNKLADALSHTSIDETSIKSMEELFNKKIKEKQDIFSNFKENTIFVNDNLDYDKSFISESFTIDMEDLLGTIRIIAKGLNREWIGNKDSDAKNILRVKSDHQLLFKDEERAYGPFTSILLPDETHKENPKNKDLYLKLKSTLNRLQNGGSVTTIAYGYSGSGKTYSFFNKSKKDLGVVYEYFKKQ